MVTDKRTDRRTDRRTDEGTGRGHYDSGGHASLDSRTDKNSIMFADGIAFMCFCDAERVLSTIAKFLAHFLGRGRGGVKWKRSELGKGSGGENGMGKEV